jgi:RNA polymerase sigma-70 factor (ECF subfamily)
MPAPFSEFVPNENSAFDSTASDLLSAARRKEPQAWLEMLDRYAWLVFQWCCQAGLKGDDAADVLQTVMADVATSLSDFRKDGNKAAFRRWLRTITRRRIVDFHRTDGKQPHGEGGSAAQERILAVAEEVESSVAASPGRESLRVRFWDLLQKVEDETDESIWQAFWLMTVENLTSIEAGKQLDMTPNAVRLAKARVLQRLRQEAAALQIDSPSGGD